MKHILLTGLSLFVIFFFGCTKSEVTQTTSVKGYILLFDKNNHLVSDASEAMVTVENSNPLVTLPVNSKGEFELTELNNSGITVLAFSHAGYGTVKQYYTQPGLDSVKKGLVGIQPVALLPQSSVVVNSLTGTLTGEVFRMVCNVSAPDSSSGINGVSFFIEKDNAEVSFANCPGNNSVSRFLTIPVTTGDNSTSFCLKCSKECGFLKSGDVVYIKAYGDISTPYAYNYIDFLTDKLVFPSINSNSFSPTISFIVP